VQGATVHGPDNASRGDETADPSFPVGVHRMGRI
jgi:hypothetical protein